MPTQSNSVLSRAYLSGPWYAGMFVPRGKAPTPPRRAGSDAEFLDKEAPVLGVVLGLGDVLRDQQSGPVPLVGRVAVVVILVGRVEAQMRQLVDEGLELALGDRARHRPDAVRRQGLEIRV